MTPALKASEKARTVFCHGRISMPPLPAASAGDGGRTHGQNTSAAPNAVDIPATVTIANAIATALSLGEDMMMLVEREKKTIEKFNFFKLTESYQVPSTLHARDLAWRLLTILNYYLCWESATGEEQR